MSLTRKFRTSSTVASRITTRNSSIHTMIWARAGMRVPWRRGAGRSAPVDSVVVFVVVVVVIVVVFVVLDRRRRGQFGGQGGLRGRHRGGRAGLRRVRVG